MTVLLLVCFKIFDFDRDGVFCRSEVTQLIESLKQLAVDQFPEDESDCDSLEVSDIIKNEMESVDLETFLMWAVNGSSLKHLLDMLHQVKDFVFCEVAFFFLIYLCLFF